MRSLARDGGDFFDDGTALNLNSSRIMKKEISEREKEKERKANAERQERNERQTKEGQRGIREVIREEGDLHNQMAEGEGSIH
uniref:Uncharacterized protein n=1 Tax=Pristionchus pacificus TaxID=54126 RepID=A0A2A6C968_PRIPA|eukprot:PDM74657.1 hypothetical protein PRIPAC_42013 [Pristionchus pacificus]